MPTQPADRFIYVVGEHQNGIVAENAETLAFTRANMGKIDTGELAQVIANVFARGQFFPGPQEALTAVLHELAGRSERFREVEADSGGRCTLITAFKRLDGEISVKVSAMMTVAPATLNLEDPEGFETLLRERLPEFQDAFLAEAYAPDSKIIDIIKETTLYHIHKNLD